MLTIDFGTATQIAHHASVVLGVLIMLACIIVVMKQGQAGAGVFLFALMGGGLLAFSLWRGVEIESDGLRTLNELKIMQVEQSAKVNRLLGDLLAVDDRVNQLVVRTAPGTRQASLAAATDAKELVDRARHGEAVIVFHTSRSARDAAVIVQRLLGAGFASAAAWNDALENDPQQRPGAVRIFYREGSGESAGEVARLAREAGLASRWIDDPISSSVRAGNIEVHLF